MYCILKVFGVMIMYHLRLIPLPKVHKVSHWHPIGRENIHLLQSIRGLAGYLLNKSLFPQIISLKNEVEVRCTCSACVQDPGRSVFLVTFPLLVSETMCFTEWWWWQYKLHVTAACNCSIHLAFLGFLLKDNTRDKTECQGFIYLKTF